jgi:hypothetical protein
MILHYQKTPQAFLIRTLPVTPSCIKQSLRRSCKAMHKAQKIKQPSLSPWLEFWQPCEETWSVLQVGAKA